MKVGELIEVLKSFEPECDVLIEKTFMESNMTVVRSLDVTYRGIVLRDYRFSENIKPLKAFIAYDGTIFDEMRRVR